MNWVDTVFALGVAIAKDMKENRGCNQNEQYFDDYDNYEDDYEDED